MKDETMGIYRPQVVVTQVFSVREIQPDVETLTHLLKDNPLGLQTKYYFTNLGEEQRNLHKDIYDKASGMNGHVVIRVMPGGKEYYVIMLDDTNFDYTVKSVDGPFKCK